MFTGVILVVPEYESSVWSEGEFLFTLRSPSFWSVGELFFTLRYPSIWSVGELLFTLWFPSECLVGELLFTLRYPSERSVGVFHCFPMLNYNSSGGSSRWFLKRFSQLSGSLFVILGVVVVVKSSSKTMCNCGEIYPVLRLRTSATLPACCGDIPR